MAAAAYADTSFLVSLYVSNANSASADRRMKAHAPVRFTAFGRHELRNAVRLGAFRRQISAAEAAAVLQLVATDEAAGLLRDAPVAWSRVFARAEELSEMYSTEGGHRGMDLLHVALAQVAGARIFLTFDQRQARLAARAGLKVLA